MIGGKKRKKERKLVVRFDRLGCGFRFMHCVMRHVRTVSICRRVMTRGISAQLGNDDAILRAVGGRKVLMRRMSRLIPFYSLYHDKRKFVIWFSLV